MADKIEATVDSCSSRKRKPDGDVTSGNPNRPFVTRNDVSDDESDSGDDYFINNDKLKVKTPNSEIILFKVKRSDTIGSIKVKIQELELIPFDEQELIFDGIVLYDMDTIANLRVKKESALTLMRVSTGFINIYIHTVEDDSTRSIKVKPNDTIGSIKSKSYLYYWGVFIFNDNVLVENGTFADFNIIDGSTLTHIDRDVKRMKIFVNSITGKIFPLLVDPTYTIAFVKETIESHEDIPCDEQVLIYNNMVPGDNGTLFDFNIIRKSTLTLLRKPRGIEGFMRIFIKTVIGDTFMLEVKSSDTIGKIKVKIQDSVDVPCDEQELIFNEMVLHDANTLADFHINKESTLTLMRISNGLMRIFIKCYNTKETFTLDVAPSDSIRDVKSKLFKKRNFSPLKQILMFNRKQLEDSATLANYHISKESTLYCDF